MAKTCSVCAHEQSEQITSELVNGVPLRTLAEKYGLSVGALHRHKQHIVAQMANSGDVGELQEPGTVLKRIADLDERADRLYREAVKNKDLLNATRALKELREIISLYAKLTGELNTQAQVVHQHLHVTPEWITLRQQMLSALAPYPEARAALITVLGSDDSV
ncbi:MAG: hypothetical protein Q4E13_08510 [Clostridia bacterium]|nr:hypothetical protein [Clostridia bacterium]